MVLIIGMNAVFSRKELEAQVRKDHPTLKIVGWNDSGDLVVSVDMAHLIKESLKDEEFFIAKDRQFILVNRKGWKINLQ